MNWASARCSRASWPRSTVKRAPHSLAAVSPSSQPLRAPSSTWSLTSKSKLRGVPQRCCSTLSASSLPTGTDASGRLGMPSAIASISPRSRSSSSSEAFSSSPNAATSAITAETSSPLALACRSACCGCCAGSAVPGCAPGCACARFPAIRSGTRRVRSREWQAGVRRVRQGCCATGLDQAWAGLAASECALSPVCVAIAEPVRRNPRNAMPKCGHGRTTPPAQIPAVAPQPETVGNRLRQRPAAVRVPVAGPAQ